VFEVKESDGSFIGLLYTNYFPRANKKGGAWMSALRKQYRINGKNITPVIVNVGNLSKPTGSKSALLSWEEVTTVTSGRKCWTQMHANYLSRRGFLMEKQPILSEKTSWLQGDRGSHEALFSFSGIRA